MNTVLRLPSCRTVSSLARNGKLRSSAHAMLFPKPDKVLTAASTQNPSTLDNCAGEVSRLMPIVPFTTVEITE